MDMSETKQSTLWVFTDSPNLPLYGLFENCTDEISKNGATSFPVITLDSSGVKLKLSKWRTEVADCVRQYGKDSDQWKGKLVQVTKDEKKGKLVLKPVEEKIQ